METTNERINLGKEKELQEERDLRRNREKFDEDTNYGEFLCGCDTGKCFDCGI